jgi:hypothetical protein
MHGGEMPRLDAPYVPATGVGAFDFDHAPRVVPANPVSTHLASLRLGGLDRP